MDSPIGEPITRKQDANWRLAYKTKQDTNWCLAYKKTGIRNVRVANWRLCHKKTGISNVKCRNTTPNRSENSLTYSNNKGHIFVQANILAF